jgi:hypothetical protein
MSAKCCWHIPSFVTFRGYVIPRVYHVTSCWDRAFGLSRGEGRCFTCHALLEIRAAPRAPGGSRLAAEPAGVIKSRSKNGVGGASHVTSGLWESFRGSARPRYSARRASPLSTTVPRTCNPAVCSACECPLVWEAAFSQGTSSVWPKC